MLLLGIYENAKVAFDANNRNAKTALYIINAII
jgi:hypothetical protein